MECRYAKHSVWVGVSDACTNPDFHGTRCDTNKCAYAKAIGLISESTADFPATEAYSTATEAGIEFADENWF